MGVVPVCFWFEFGLLICSTLMTFEGIFQLSPSHFAPFVNDLPREYGFMHLLFIMQLKLFFHLYPRETLEEATETSFPLLTQEKTSHPSCWGKVVPR